VVGARSKVMRRYGAYGLPSVALVFFCLLRAVPVAAQERTSGAPTASPTVVLTRASLAKLKSSDANEIKAGLDDARISGKGAFAAAALIVDRLEKGLPYPLTIAAIDTLGDIESEPTSATVSWYVRHRNVEIRRSAVRALVRTKGSPAVTALREALSDEDAKVRAFAAMGLGALRAKETVADLFVALDHRVNEAAVSIGQLCGPSECEALEGRLGRVPFDVVSSGLDQILFRPAAEVNDDAKVRLIGRLRELGTGEANRFLRDVLDRWPKGWSTRIKQSIDQAVLATSGSPKSSPREPASRAE
jgi:HEAT repeat protein